MDDHLDGKTNNLKQPTFDDLVDKLAQIIKSSKKSVKLAAHPIDAAKQFLIIIGNQKPGEKIKLVKNVKKNKEFYVWPYAENAKYLLKKFLNGSFELQTIVVAAREDGIFWRGDELDNFYKIIDETEKMRTMGIAEYKRQALRSMRNLLNSVTGKVDPGHRVDAA